MLDQIDERASCANKRRLKHGLTDHYLQRAILPHETEARTWMRGAAAHVNGRKIYFRDIIGWCQKNSTWHDRQILQRETGPLCKFLKPFALNSWRTLLAVLREELGYRDYVDYCTAKKGLDYGLYYSMLKELLEETDCLYFPAMEQWCRRSLGRGLQELTRFDAIYLLGLGEFDGLYPSLDLENLLGFFRRWEMDPKSMPGLSIELGNEERKSGQAMCFVLAVPEEVYVLVKPEGGWVDLEALFHELGHGLAAVLTSSELGIVERDLNLSFSLSEAFAFLVQNTALSRSFLSGFVGLAEDEVKRLTYYKALKDMSVFRRYAAKFISEYEMFLSENIQDGASYAANMARYTGFYYQPESHLFDLVPEFYSLDYVLAWMAEAAMQKRLREELGPQWPLSPDTGGILRSWWNRGGGRDLDSFMCEEGLGKLSTDAIKERWWDLAHASP